MASCNLHQSKNEETSCSHYSLILLVTNREKPGHAVLSGRYTGDPFLFVHPIILDYAPHKFYPERTATVN